MYGPEGNSYFCFPESPDLSRDEVLYCIFRLSLKQPYGKNMLLYSARRQQLPNCISVGIHLNLIKGT